jgi:IS605 OrfB family transposase
LHIISKQFVSVCEEKGVTSIILGDISGIRDNIDYSKRLNQQLAVHEVTAERSEHNWNFAQLIDFIKYKAEKIGILTELISEKYTSQTSCACGTVDKSNRKTRGLYVCSCGNRINADRNGANNILKRYLRNRSSGSMFASLSLPTPAPPTHPYPSKEGKKEGGEGRGDWRIRWFSAHYP